jgi:hypothetical protein
MADAEQVGPVVFVLAFAAASNQHHESCIMNGTATHPVIFPVFVQQLSAKCIFVGFILSEYAQVICSPQCQ